MLHKLLLLLVLVCPGFAEEPPDVDCVVLHLESVKCTWNKHGNPKVNYTFRSWFHDEAVRECEKYITNNSLKIGCIQPYGDRTNRFFTFYMQLVHGNNTFSKSDELKSKVKLNPPTNLTVQNGSDWNLWFYWNQTLPSCVENEVRSRINYKEWVADRVNRGKQNYCINLPSSRSQYELQVRSKLHEVCGASGWSDWSDSVMWGSNNGTESDQGDGYMFVWIIVYVLAPVILIAMVFLLVRYERFRIIFIRVVPKPSLIPQDIEPWPQIPKGLKEGFKANYHEQACPVREYRQVPQ